MGYYIRMLFGLVANDGDPLLDVFLRLALISVVLAVVICRSLADISTRTAWRRLIYDLVNAKSLWPQFWFLVIIQAVLFGAYYWWVWYPAPMGSFGKWSIALAAFTVIGCSIYQYLMRFTELNYYQCMRVSISLTVLMLVAYMI